MGQSDWTGLWRLSGTEEVVTGADAAAVVRVALETGSCDLSFEHGVDMSLSIASNGDRAVLIFWGREGFDEGVIAVDREAAVDDRERIIAGGQVGIYPRRETIPIGDAIEAVRYVIDRGQRSPALHWEGW